MVENTSFSLIYRVDRSLLMQVFLYKDGGQFMHSFVGGQLDGHITNHFAMRQTCQLDYIVDVRGPKALFFLPKGGPITYIPVFHGKAILVGC